MENRKPIIGEQIYVPTSLYVYRGEDDFAGGIATISKIENSKHLPEDHFNYTMIAIKERQGTMYNWKNLLERQEQLKEEYKNQVAHPDPDYRAEFNDDNADWK